MQNQIKAPLLISLCLAHCSTSPAVAAEELSMVLDGYAYTIDSDVLLDLEKKNIIIDLSNATNCLRPGGLLPLNQVNTTLVTNGQTIGLSSNHYLIPGNLLFLTSESSNLICDNGIFVDHIFVNGFEIFVSPFLIFKNGVEP